MIEAALQRLGVTFNMPSGLARDTQRLSDFYLENPKAMTPWQEPWVQRGYLAYFLLLNHVRARAVVQEGLAREFFLGLDSIIDFGSGLGSASAALLEVIESSELPYKPQWRQILNIEISKEAQRLHQDLHRDLLDSVEQKWQTSLKGWPESIKSRTTLCVFSYSFTEVDQFPAWALEGEALMILEPSTRQDGRRLLELRRKLQENGYHLYAPCTHQKDCPLLKESSSDWCHDRISWHFSNTVAAEAINAESWRRFENLLRMKNHTLSFSYLLARRTPPKVFYEDLVRVIGDELSEKGKTKQMICRGSKREFLAWFPQRMNTEVQLSRGDLFRFTEPLETKANEVRLKSSAQIEDIKKGPIGDQR